MDFTLYRRQVVIITKAFMYAYGTCFQACDEQVNKQN